MLIEIMHKSGKESIPNYRRQRATKSACRGIWNNNINKASKQSKYIYANWKTRGRCCAKLKSEMITAKRKLRRLQRQAQASKKNKNINEKMSASDNNTKLFHKLIRNQRNVKSQETAELKVNNITYEEDAIIQGWGQHFTTLATPDLSKPAFDLEKLNLVKIQNEIIEDITKKLNKQIEEATSDEVIQVISKLKSGKSCDNEGIAAEHLKYAAEELAPYIRHIINIIFKD